MLADLRLLSATVVADPMRRDNRPITQWPWVRAELARPVYRPEGKQRYQPDGTPFTIHRRETWSCCWPAAARELARASLPTRKRRSCGMNDDDVMRAMKM